MKNLGRTAAIMFGVVGLSGVGAALSAGCSGDDTVVGYPGDGSTDSPTVDTSVPDTSTPTDAGGDAFVFDAGPPNLGSFYLQINQTGCAWLENCCGGPTQFDDNMCVQLFNNPATFGFLFTRTVEDQIDGGGNVTFDSAKAAQCLSLIQDMSCTAAFTSTQAQAIRDACYGAIQGNIPAGSTGCQSTIECAAPAHCSAGTCVAPFDAGANCITTADDLTNINNCGRAYAGEPRYCEVGDFLTIAEAGTCDPGQANGSTCYSPFECSSWLCDTNATTPTCTDSVQFIVPGAGGTCAGFAPTDAGDGG